MNLNQLNKQLGKTLRLRPLPARIGPDGGHLAPSDDQWRLEAILQQPSRIRLINIHTDDFVELQPDNVREYRSPDFLLLRCQLIINGPNIEIEPILGNQATASNQSQLPTYKLTGEPLELLGYCVRRENSGLSDYAGADDAIASLGFTVSSYKKAAEDLADLGLITIHRSVNHPSGIVRTSLQPVAFLETAPHFLTDVDLQEELQRILAALRQVPEDDSLIRVQELIQRTVIPLPRLDLMLRALQDMGYLVGRGLGNDDCGSFFYVEITRRGRRMLLGEESFDYDR